MNLQPPDFLVVFFLGAHMKIGVQIEQIRQKMGLSIVFMCNAMDLTPGEYERLAIGRYSLNTFQLISFISATRHSLAL